MAMFSTSSIAGLDSNITGTGTYLPLTMYTGGSERLRIDTSGNVGVGTTSSAITDKLTVVGAGETGGISDSGAKSAAIRVASTGGNANDGGQIEFGAGYGSYTQSYFAGIKGLLNNGAINSTGNLAFYTRNNVTDASLTERMRIESNGNVGIGTQSPVAKLDVLGTSRYYFNVSNAYTLQASVNPANNAFVDNYKNALSHTWQTSGTDRMTIASNGIITGTAGNLMLVSGTAKAWNWNSLTTNTFIDFTDIPSWVKRVTVMFDGVSTTGTSFRQIQLIYGGATVVSSGYQSSSTRFNGTTLVEAAATTGYLLVAADAASLMSGSFTLTNLSGNTWTGFGGTTYSAGGNLFSTGGVTIAGTLTGVRITTVNGTDRFDAGSINILYE
jgi:hypothetical protein